MLDLHSEEGGYKASSGTQHSTGKRVHATADTLMGTVRRRGKKPTEGGKATFISGGNDQYITAILANFEAEAINYGQLIKERDGGEWSVRPEWS